MKPILFLMRELGESLGIFLGIAPSTAGNHVGQPVTAPSRHGNSVVQTEVLFSQWYGAVAAKPSIVKQLGQDTFMCKSSWSSLETRTSKESVGLELTSFPLNFSPSGDCFSVLSVASLRRLAHFLQITRTISVGHFSNALSDSKLFLPLLYIFIGRLSDSISVFCIPSLHNGTASLGVGFLPSLHLSGAVPTMARKAARFRFPSPLTPSRWKYFDRESAMA